MPSLESHISYASYNVPSLHPSASTFTTLSSAPPFLALSFCSPHHTKGEQGGIRSPQPACPKELLAIEPVIRGPLSTETSQETSMFEGGIGYKLHVQLIL